jgi:UDP-glucose 4-epimerase
VPKLIADATKVAEVWGWRTSRDLHAMVRDAWEFQRLNPLGYATSLATSPGGRKCV